MCYLALVGNQKNINARVYTYICSISKNECLVILKVKVNNKQLFLLHSQSLKCHTLVEVRPHYYTQYRNDLRKQLCRLRTFALLGSKIKYIPSTDHKADPKNERRAKKETCPHDYVSSRCQVKRAKRWWSTIIGLSIKTRKSQKIVVIFYVTLPVKKKLTQCYFVSHKWNISQVTARTHSEGL